MNDNPLYEMFSLSGGTMYYDKDLKTLQVDMFRALNNIEPKDIHPIDENDN